MITSTATTTPLLDVPEDEQASYVESSYCDYLMLWRSLERNLAAARREGDHVAEARFRRELRAMWPRPEAVALAAGILKFAS